MKSPGKTFANLEKQLIRIRTRLKTENITVIGDTASRTGFAQLRKAIEAAGLEILQENVEEQGQRDNFTMTIVPKK